MRNLLKIAPLASSTLLVAGCNDDDKHKLETPRTPVATPITVVDVAVSDGNVTTFVAALKANEFYSVLADGSPQYAIFAPTDDAFAMPGEETVSTLLNITNILIKILLQHVVMGEVDFITAYALNGLGGETVSSATLPISINAETNSLILGGGKIICEDMYTANGIIHVIDTVFTETLN